MLLKTCMLASCLLTPPILWMSATAEPQGTSESSRADAAGGAADPAGSPPGGGRVATLRAEVNRLRHEVTRLRDALEVAESEVDTSANQLAVAREQVERALAELRAALDMWLSDDGRRERNCSPSRRLLTQHEWLHQRGHTEHAERALARIVKAHRNDRSRINSLAWHLMADDETAGQFDATALRLAQHMLASNDNLDHRQLDTVALAHFMNGHVAKAVEFERRAVAETRSSDYRRRLRTYEAALVAVEAERRKVAATALAAAASAETAPVVASTPSEPDAAASAVTLAGASAATASISGDSGDDD